LRLTLSLHRFQPALALSLFFALATLCSDWAHQTPQAPAEKPAATPSTPSEKSEIPAQIELLETHYRFEANGDSRKEVHARVHLNNELGVRQFARLNFDYNRTFQSIEISLVHISHPSGGTADILPSAITDNPNPAVLSAPAYQDVRVKSIRILGLEPGDFLEYRVITTTTRHPLAPDFWLDHSFDRSGVVTHEIFELDLPATSQAKVRINPQTPLTPSSPQEQQNDTRVTYRWDRNQPARAASVENPEPGIADVSLSTFKSWDQLAGRLAKLLVPTLDEGLPAHKAFTIPNSDVVDGEMDAVYEFVSKKIRTVDLPLGATGYRRRKPMDIFDSGYGSAEDKFALFAAMLGGADIGFVPESSRHIADEPASPARFTHLLTGKYQVGMYYWLDLNIEVAPRGMIPPQFRSKPIFVVEQDGKPHWQTTSIPLLYKSAQTVKVSAALDADGKLTAKVHYAMRGDNELLLRVAFHQSPKDKWKELAQLLALSDGFRGQVTNVSASDPYATKEPFTVDYEITQPKFVDWSKKPVRVPALLPELGLPDPPLKPASGTNTSPIELGTPLEVETHMTLHLPAGTTIVPPIGTSVVRDYATFASQYSAKGQTVTASRHINFLERQLPADRATDYHAFLRAVQNDQAQEFALERQPAPAAEQPTAAKPKQ